MARPTQTFSESWHRVANARVTLRPALKMRRVYFRGELWHVVGDPFSNQYFRVRPAAYDFVSRLDGRRTVEDCWRESIAHNPDAAPGQEEVIQLLAQLYHGNLIRSDLAPDSTKLFERYRKRREKEIKGKLTSILFVRIPLIDPDAFLKKGLPYVRWLFGWSGALIWAGVVFAALKVILENFGTLWDQSQSVLAPANLPLLYLGMVIIKILHELGHGFACRRFGGEVHTLGVMLLIFTPMPFVDATSSWNFRSRWQRILVASAGMIVEVFVAAIATFIWSATGPGTVHSLAYNMMFIASVSTILFNANPLLRFDGYYILSDLLEMPNLHQRAARMWKHVCEKYLFGYRKSVKPSESRREAGILLTFGALSWIYRIFIFTGILLFVASKFFFIGIVIACVGIITWLFVPTFKIVKYLATSPRIERTRNRAVAVTVGGLGAIVLILAVLPFPHWFSAPGIVRAENYSGAFVETSGILKEIVAPSGGRVSMNQTLLRFENRELELDIAASRAGLEEALAEEQRSLSQNGEDLGAIRERIATIRQRISDLEAQHDDLELKAPIAGIWVAPDLEEMLGLWLPRGTAVGEVIDPDKFLFSAVTSQEDASYLFRETVLRSEVRIPGQAWEKIPVTGQTLIPAERTTLPSAALGWLGGGEVAVDVGDASGMRAAEAFFEFRAELGPSGEAALCHGRSGKIRCTLPAEPLLGRGLRMFRQLLQRRFGV